MSASRETAIRIRVLLTILAVLLLCLAAGGCTWRSPFVRTATEETKREETQVTKTEDNFEIDLIITTPTGPQPVVGNVKRTTFSERLTKEQATAEKRSGAEVDTAALLAMLQKFGGIGTGGLSSLFGGLLSPEGIITGGSAILALIFGTKKAMDSKKDRESKQQAEIEMATAQAKAQAETARREKAERDGDEGWDLAMKNKP